MFSFRHSALEMSSPGVEPLDDKDSAYCKATCHLPPGTFCIVSVIAKQANSAGKGGGFNPPCRHFFFFRLDLLLRAPHSV